MIKGEPKDNKCLQYTLLREISICIVFVIMSSLVNIENRYSPDDCWVSVCRVCLAGLIPSNYPEEAIQP